MMLPPDLFTLFFLSNFGELRNKLSVIIMYFFSKLCCVRNKLKVLLIIHDIFFVTLLEIQTILTLIECEVRL